MAKLDAILSPPPGVTDVGPQRFSDVRVDPHAEDFFELLQQHSMLWLSIAIIKRTAGDLYVARHREYRENAEAWAREYRNRTYRTSLPCCCDWINGVLPGEQQIDPREMSRLLLRFPQRVRRVCDRYLQDNLPDFHAVYRERTHTHLGFRQLIKECVAPNQSSGGPAPSQTAPTPPVRGACNTGIEQLVFAF